MVRATGVVLRVLAVWCIASLAFVACSSGSGSDDDVDTAEIYAAVVRWFVDEADLDADRPVVFLTSLGEGLGIGLDTQAAVVSATESFADARFVDDWSEALGDDGVRHNGIFLAFGPIVEAGARVNVECDRVRSETVRVQRTFELAIRDGEWVLTGEPTRS